MFWAALKFWFKRDVKTWRALRREAMALLPKQEKAADVENGQ